MCHHYVLTVLSYSLPYYRTNLVYHCFLPYWLSHSIQWRKVWDRVFTWHRNRINENCPWASVSTWKYRCITPNMPPFVLLHICYKVPARYFCARLSFLTRTICAVAFINTHFNNKKGETISHNFWHSTSVIHCYANSIHCLLRNCKMRCLENCCNQQCSSAFLLWHFFKPTLHIFTASTKWIVRNSGTRCRN